MLTPAALAVGSRITCATLAQSPFSLSVDGMFLAPPFAPTLRKSLKRSTVAPAIVGLESGPRGWLSSQLANSSLGSAMSPSSMHAARSCDPVSLVFEIRW